MHAVDTNVLVRLVARDDTKQLEAAERFVQAGGWVSHLALAELTWVLESVYDRHPAQIADAVEMLLDHATLAVQDAELVSAAVRTYRRSPRVGFSDCLMLEAARKAGHMPLGTFDRQLARLSGAQGL